MQGVGFTVLLSTAAVMGCSGGRRLKAAMFRNTIKYIKEGFRSD
jgi:hypothetical protein